MRLVIDIQGCQSGSPDDVADTLAWTLAIATAAGQHDVWLVLNKQLGATIEALRLAFDGLVARSRVVVFDVPVASAPDTPSAAWCERAAEQIRAGFVASLNPDVVLVPNLASTPAAEVVRSPDRPAGGYPEVLLIAESALGEPGAASDAVAPRWAGLKRAAVLLVAPGAEPKLPVGSRERDAVTLITRCADATAVWAALHGVLAAAATPGTPAPVGSQQRARLAYISPLPPERSGIADYSAELIRQLASYYDIDVIIDQQSVSDPWIRANLRLRTVAWFEAHAAEFERVLYHFGNSPMHQHMFRLLALHPGIVVLHDFYFGHVLAHMHGSGFHPGAFLQAQYESHGFGALIRQGPSVSADAMWRYPGNKRVLDRAFGIIVHSQLSRQLAAHWYGQGFAADWRVIPHLRGHSRASLGRKAARERLKLPNDDFIVCSFGVIGPAKRIDALLAAWLASPLAADQRCRLLLVGENAGGDNGDKIVSTIAGSAAPERITITGFVDHPTFSAYLEAADAAVQLRKDTRGETSGSVLDCLLHGVPTIVNAHGSMAELPDTVVVKLDDEFELTALRAALERLWRDEALRLQLARAAREYVAVAHAPERIGTMYVDAIEHFIASSPKRHYRDLMRAIAEIATPAMSGAPSPSDLARTAEAIAANQPPTLPRQLLVDVSAIVRTDLKTGIERVVRSVLGALFDSPPPGYRIEAVYSDGGGAPYRYARRYMQVSFGCAVPELADAPIEVRAGDLFLGLDLHTQFTHQNQALLQDYRDRGVRLYFVVFDLLAVLRPEFFPAASHTDGINWLGTVAAVADGLVCISRAVAADLRAWLAAHPVRRLRPPTIGSFHLGADIRTSAPTLGLPRDADQILERVGAMRSLLMVGTVEPRKGHAQALAAFDTLWSGGAAANLVIVGKQGWMVDELAARLRAHPENGSRLLWLTSVSDELLAKLYQASAGLLAASEGEGFGLPLVEAAQHRLPIVARKLPVFQEVCGEHAWYFEGLAPAALADALREWLQLLQEGRAPRSDRIAWLTWKESAAQLVDAIRETT